MSRHAASWLLIGVVTLYSSAIWADTSCISTVQSAQQSIVQNAYRSQQLKPAWISQSLNRLLQADARCAQASGGICRLDVDPLYDAQDIEVQRIRYRCNDKRVIAQLSDESGAARRIDFSFVHERGAWKIDDVHYTHSPSLKQLLTQ